MSHIFFFLLLFCFIVKNNGGLFHRVAVVTGANQGIGYGIVKGLCENFDGTVYLTARNVTRGKAAVKELNKLNLKPVFHQLDITDKQSVKVFADYIKEKHGGLDVLVNNAGVCYFFCDEITDMVWMAEQTLKVNYFGLLNVCHALYPLLRHHARVVHLSSNCGAMTKYRITTNRLRRRFLDQNLNEEKLTALMNEYIISVKNHSYLEDGWSEDPYTVSSIAITALTFVHYQKFLEDSRRDIVVNAVHPGICNTSMTRNLGYRTIEKGAQAPLYLALLPKFAGSPRGDFVWKDNRSVNWLDPPFGI